MAVFDARQSRQAFDATDSSLVDFSSLASTNSTTYVWNTTGSGYVQANGVNITVDDGGIASSGVVKSLVISTETGGEGDAVISGLNVSLPVILDNVESFWASVLKGHDTIRAPQSFDATLFGDALTVFGSTRVIGGRDTIAGGTGAAQTFYGDAATVGQDPTNNGLVGTLTGGRDTIIANNTDGNSLIVGDAGTVDSGSRLDANADILTGSNSRADTIYGDAALVFDSVCVGANDTINGRGGDDLLVGDVNRVQRFPGATSGPFASGGHDLINGGTGNDVVIGDMQFVSNADVGAISEARGGNDRLYGNDGDDTIYGDTVDANDAFVLFGRDRIYGGDGNDIIYGDAKSFPNGLPPDVELNGHDVIYGGAGNDTIDGGVGNDRILGEIGTDVLVGGYGSDQLTGGADADVFRFFSGSGHDRVFDFTDDLDELQISATYGYSNAADVVATATIHGNDVTLHLTADDTITLLNFGSNANQLLNDILIV